MTKRWAILLGLAVGACAPVARPDDAGARILSLNPCTDAILAELADPGQIVALSAFSRDPAQSSMDIGLARHWPATDGTVEEVIAARPSLVVAGGFTPPATRAAYARLGVPLVEFGMATTVADSVGQIRQMARLTGHPARGEAMVARIERALQSAAPPRGAQAIPALVWQGGGLVAGPHTLISELLVRTGFVPISATKGLTQSQFLPLEAVVADPPAVILAVSHGAGGESGRSLSHPVLGGLRATQRFTLDPALEFCGGPTILRAAARLAEIRRSMENGA